MRYILSLIVFILLINTGQSQILLLMDDVAGIDTIPSQFTFTDVTDAALSSYNQAYIVVAGCDSARFYPASGDSLKLGALGTYDVSPIWADAGDSIYTGLVASGTNSTATHSIIYSSNGTPYDTFSVTTEAGGFTPASLNPVLYIVHDQDSTVISGSNTVVSIVENGFLFSDGDTTTTKVIRTDSSFYFDNTANNRLSLTDAGGNPFDIGTGDMSIDAWVWISTSNSDKRIFGKPNAPGWLLETETAAEYNQVRFYAFNSDYTEQGIANGADVNYSGAWHHFAASWDRNGYVIFFVDSVSYYSSDVDFADMVAIDINSAGTTDIGSQDLGHIAAIRFYNYALTPAQVKSLYEYGRE